MGHARPPRRDRGREASRLLRQAADRGLRHRGVQPRLPRERPHLRAPVARDDRAGGVLDRHGRSLLHLHQRVRRVGVVVAAPALGPGPPRPGLQDPALLRALRHDALEPRGGAELQGGRGPLGVGALPGAAGAAGARPRRRGGAARRRAARRLDDDAVDPARPRRPRREPRPRLPHRRGPRGRRHAPALRRRAPRRGAVRLRRGRQAASRRPARPAGRGPGARARPRRGALRPARSRPASRTAPTSRPRGPSPRPPSDETGWAVVLGDYVTATDGTGLVHTAPPFGEDDYRTGLAYGLPFFLTIDGEGGSRANPGSRPSRALGSRRPTRPSRATCAAAACCSTATATATATRSAGAATRPCSTTPRSPGS